MGVRGFLFVKFEILFKELSDRCMRLLPLQENVVIIGMFYLDLASGF
ncbi:hypothetical protein B597_012690 [Stutzerimonas stutzeri KOS6]|uniref:Uncharacterized protein n=1 Tax=Stutzerimonas stutzeri KOS6 TaxID=1218352 RepID=A0A061JR97_STUST|nr:hypothetical protein B597_012690 [Stutzerimonas stutzeri KOS6]